MFLISHPDHAGSLPTQESGELPTHALQRLPLALPSSSHGLRRTLEQAASSLKIALNPEYELDTLTVMKDVALSGIAHTVLALPAVVKEVHAGRLTATALTAPEIETRLTIATSLNRPLTRAGRAVLEQLRPVLQESISSALLPLHIDLE